MKHNQLVCANKETTMNSGHYDQKLYHFRCIDPAIKKKY